MAEIGEMTIISIIYQRKNRRLTMKIGYCLGRIFLNELSF